MDKIKIALLILIGILIVSISDAAWWNGSFPKKAAINLSVSSGHTGLNYQVPINVTYDTDMNSSFKDLRFLNSAEDTELDYYIIDKVDSLWAYIWVEVGGNITTTNQTLVYMYYGNNEVSSTSNEYATFLLYDDFLGTSLNVSQWRNQTLTGSFSINNSIISLLTVDVKIQSLTDYGNATVMEYKGWHALTNYNAIGFLDWDDFNNYMSFYKVTGAHTARTNIDSDETTTVGNTGAWHEWRIERWGNTRYYIDDVSVANHSQTTTTARCASLTIYTTNQNLTVDWLRVRKYHDPEPVYSIGNEESIPQITLSWSSDSDSGTKYQNFVFINVTVGNVGVLDTILLQWEGVNESFDNNYYENKTELQREQWYLFYAFANNTLGQMTSINRTVHLDYAVLWNVSEPQGYYLYLMALREKEGDPLPPPKCIDRTTTFKEWGNETCINNATLQITKYRLWECAPYEIWDNKTTNVSCIYGCSSQRCNEPFSDMAFFIAFFILIIVLCIIFWFVKRL